MTGKSIRDISGLVSRRSLLERDTEVQCRKVLGSAGRVEVSGGASLHLSLEDSCWRGKCGDAVQEESRARCREKRAGGRDLAPGRAF